MANPLIRVTPLGRAFDVANYVFLGLFALSILYPFWTVITTSLASPVSLPGRGCTSGTTSGVRRRGGSCSRRTPSGPLT